MPLKVTVVQKAKGTYEIHPEGSIDSATHTILGAEVDAILKTSPQLVIFDMKDVGFVSSAGVSIVLMVEQVLKQQGGSTLMVNLQPQIQKVFDIVQALPRQQIFASTVEMDRYLAVMQRRITEGEEE